MLEGEQDRGEDGVAVAVGAHSKGVQVAALGGGEPWRKRVRVVDLEHAAERHGEPVDPREGRRGRAHGVDVGAPAR